MHFLSKLAIDDHARVECRDIAKSKMRTLLLIWLGLLLDARLLAIADEHYLMP